MSIGTVRRVLYGLAPVRPETAGRVNEALAELAYVPNPHARALVGGRAPLIALVVPQLTWYVANVLVVTLQQRIAALGLRSAFFVSGAGPVEQAVAELQQLAPQAVVLVQVAWHDAYRRLPDAGIDLLTIDVRPGLPPDVPADGSALDRIGAFRLATRHLLDLGHRRIGLLDSYGARGRREGYEQAMQEAGADFRAVQVADAEGVRAPDIPTCLDRILADHPDLTALVCTTDLWAQETIHHLADRGLTTPQDISVTGYSNEPWTLWTRPSLTTLDQGTALLCDHALSMMARRQEGSSEPWSRRVILPELVVRGSTAPVGESTDDRTRRPGDRHAP